MKFISSRRECFRTYFLTAFSGLSILWIVGMIMYGASFAAEATVEGFFEIIIVPLVALVVIALGFSDRPR